MHHATLANAHGSVFTRPEVVEFILDLSGYTIDKPLFHSRILEPSAGDGNFLIPIIKRMLQAWKTGIKNMVNPITCLSNAISAVELHPNTYDLCRKNIITCLTDEQFSFHDAKQLADHWLQCDNFLLCNVEGKYDYIIGNPPYVRQESIPEELVQIYRKRFISFYDRADLYIPFIEKSLGLLAPNGNMTLICSDRWMKNKYGAPLRNIISKNFYLKYFIDMMDTDSFHKEVSAYPAITVISPGKKNTTRIAHKPRIETTILSNLAKVLQQPILSDGQNIVKEIKGVVSGFAPWILESSEQLTLLRKLESKFPLLEEAGCKVGIGVATGADSVFIAPFHSLDVEDSRKLSLVTTKDIQKDNINWKGLAVINPFEENGQLVDLRSYPRLRKYLEMNKSILIKRHVAEKNSRNWYRTIDRITPALALKPKLLIPDIKGDACILYEEGKFYPHHNLYYITSDCWNLYALKAVLFSGVALLFVSLYSTRMRGGYFRFQAQYLRRIRIPQWKEIDTMIQQELTQAGINNDRMMANEAVFKMFKLDPTEREALANNGNDI